MKKFSAIFIRVMPIFSAAGIIYEVTVCLTDEESMKRQYEDIYVYIDTLTNRVVAYDVQSPYYLGRISAIGSCEEYQDTLKAAFTAYQLGSKKWISSVKEKDHEA